MASSDATTEVEGSGRSSPPPTVEYHDQYYKFGDPLRIYVDYKHFSGTAEAGFKHPKEIEKRENSLEFEYNHNWEACVKTHFNKFPTPRDPRITVKLLSKDVDDATGIETITREFSLKNTAPFLLRKLLVHDAALFEERCIIDRQKRYILINTRNTNFTSFGYLGEESVFAQHPEDSDRTLFQQTGVFRTTGLVGLLQRPFRSYLSKVMREGAMETAKEFENDLVAAKEIPNTADEAHAEPSSS